MLGFTLYHRPTHEWTWNYSDIIIQHNFPLKHGTDRSTILRMYVHLPLKNKDIFRNTFLESEHT